MIIADVDDNLMMTMVRRITQQLHGAQNYMLLCYKHWSKTYHYIYQL